ncbi:unnamed protein product [Pleuronectes platessa]|uniref:Uncharacterized protein n=1 Tax=Pleuronectes platessa TaxID=8262 RepID=A0A9N7VRP8_PLEPL|nr:unnamed protein product [Pleuronectes platessa]
MWRPRVKGTQLDTLLKLRFYGRSRHLLSADRHEGFEEMRPNHQLEEKMKKQASVKAQAVGRWTSLPPPPLPSSPPPPPPSPGPYDRMYLIILPSVTLRRLFGGRYLFVPSDFLRLGSDPFSYGSPLYRPLSSNLRVTDSPGGGLMALLYAPHRVVTLVPSQPSKTVWERCWRRDELLSPAQHAEK